MPARLLPAWLVAVVLSGCGGNEFQSSGGGGSGQATGGASGAGPTGGASGSAGMATGGTGGDAGSGMTGGTGGAPCNCPPTTYCRNGTCLACSELSTLEFGDPELLYQDPLGVRFPRSGSEDGSMFLRLGPEGSAHLAFATSSGIGSPGGPAGSQQSAPLLVDGLDSRFNFIFDQSLNGTRNVRSATWDGAGLTGEAEMPPPLSPGGFEDYSPAAATGTGRLYWMSTRDGTAMLRTGTVSTGEGDIVTIDVPKRGGSGTCQRTGGDATPWVTPDGKRMFFRSVPFDDGCQPIESATDLFVVPIEPTSGIPTQAAQELTNLNRVGSTETDPSLSPDFCTLYFASDVGASAGLAFRAYRASRR